MDDLLAHFVTAGLETCGCCEGRGTHPDGSECDRCDGSGRMHDDDPRHWPYCPSRQDDEPPPPRRRHWREPKTAAIRTVPPEEYGKYEYPDYPAKTLPALAGYFRKHEPDYYAAVHDHVGQHGVQEAMLVRTKDPRGTPLKRPRVMSGHHRAAAAYEHGQDIPVGDYDDQEDYDASNRGFGHQWWRDHHELKESYPDPRYATLARVAVSLDELDQHLENWFHPQQLDARQERHPKSGFNIKVGLERRLARPPEGQDEAPAHFNVTDHGPVEGSLARWPKHVGTEPIQHVYRGMHTDEWEQAKRQGHIKSDQRGTIADWEGTNAAVDPHTAVSYLPSRGTGVIAKIRVHPDDKWFSSSADSYVRTRNKIPLDRVEAVSPPITKGGKYGGNIEHIGARAPEIGFQENYHGRHRVWAADGGLPAGESGYGGSLGELHWHPETGDITYLKTLGGHERRGIATALWHRAHAEAGSRGLTPPRHVESRTPAGDAWAGSVGGETPPMYPECQDPAWQKGLPPESQYHPRQAVADYRQPHEGPDADSGEAMHELGSGIYPADVHDHLAGYGAQHHETMHSVRKARGNPDAKIRIYRALPKPHRAINPGDWVTTARDYALEHAQESDPHEAYPVIRATVPAKHLRNDGNSLEEWSYHGPATAGMMSHPGGQQGDKGGPGSRHRWTQKEFYGKGWLEEAEENRKQGAREGEQIAPEEFRGIPLYHGSNSDFEPGDLLTPGGGAEHGSDQWDNAAHVRGTHVYTSRSPASAEYAANSHPDACGMARVYEVEHTGPAEPDHVYDANRGDPGLNYKTRHPVRVIRKIDDWREEGRQRHQGARQREGDERGFGDYTMRYHTEDLGERKPRHVIETHAQDGSVAGRLNWYGTTGVIHHLEVAGDEDTGEHGLGNGQDHRRKGIATAMWNWGQEMSPKPKHSGDRTEQGKAWARSVGGPGLNKHQGAHTAADVGDYGIGHRPMKDGAPAHDLREGYAEDIYTHPQYWAAHNPPERSDMEGLSQLRRVRGKPEAMVHIYRASHKDAPHEINTGDWVTLSRSYAHQHAEAESGSDDPAAQYRVHHAEVAAKHVRDAGTDQYREQGYWGPPITCCGHGKTAVMALGMNNPHTGGDEWFHGTQARPEELGHGFDDPASMASGAFEMPDAEEGGHWNALLGTHFTADHDVAKQFAKGEHASGANDRQDDEFEHDPRPVSQGVVHARLGLHNPKVYASEHDMDHEAYEHEYAAGNHPSNHVPGIGSHDEDDDDAYEAEEMWPNAHRIAKDYGHDKIPASTYGHHGTQLANHPMRTGWLNTHPDKFDIAGRFKKRLQDQGHDGVIYGNEYEKSKHGANGNRSAIAFRPHQIQVTQHHHADKPCLDPEEAERTQARMPGRGQMELPFERKHHEAAAKPVKPLRMEPGLYYRSHSRSAPFGPEHASTKNIGEAPHPDLAKYFEPKKGYSAFWDPHHVQQYHQEMGWDDPAEKKQSKIIAFRGTPVGEGGDGEPRVVPHSSKPEESMSWQHFEDRLEVTQGSGSRWDDHTWGDGPEGQQVDDGYRTIGGDHHQGARRKPLKPDQHECWKCGVRAHQSEFTKASPYAPVMGLAMECKDKDACSQRREEGRRTAGLDHRYIAPPQTGDEMWRHLREAHGVGSPAGSTKTPGEAFMSGLHRQFHSNQTADRRQIQHQHEDPGDRRSGGQSRDDSISRMFTPIPAAELEERRRAREPKPERLDDREYSIKDVSRHYDWEGFDRHEIEHLVHHPEHATFTKEDVPVHSLRYDSGDGNLRPINTYSDIAGQDEDERERLHGLEHGYEQGSSIPPIVVVRHGEHHIIADGSHRAAIHAEHGHTHIPAFVTQRTIFHGQHEAAWVPKDRIFGPTHGLDHRLFEGEHLRPRVRSVLMNRLGSVLTLTLGEDWRTLTRVWLAGSQASKWTGPELEGNGDLDVLIGLAHTHARLASPLLAGMSDLQVSHHLNVILQAQFNESHWHPPFDPSGKEYDLTGYVIHVSDIRSIKPYAAYDLTGDDWTVKPPDLPSWSAESFPQGPAVFAEARALAAQVRAILRLPEPFRTQEASRIWDSLHAGRTHDFSEQGEGWMGTGNILEKALDQAHGGLIEKLKALKYGAPGTVPGNAPMALAHGMTTADTGSVHA